MKCWQLSYPVVGAAHVTLTVDSDTASATKLRGLPGTSELGYVLAITTSEIIPAPYSLWANTVKWYFVSGLRSVISMLWLSPGVFFCLRPLPELPVKTLSKSCWQKEVKLFYVPYLFTYKAHSVIRRTLNFRRRLWQVSKIKISPKYPVIRRTQNYGKILLTTFAVLTTICFQKLLITVLSLSKQKRKSHTLQTIAKKVTHRQ